MTIGILYICTGKYNIFWKEFYESMEKFFLTGTEKHYFVFTDSPEIEYEKTNPRIHRIYQKNLGWPDNTLKRFHIFLNKEKEISKMDYLFFCNANLLVLSPITTTDILPTTGESLVATIHPGFFNKARKEFTYETNKNSTAYIALSEGVHYFAGGLNGGIAKDFIFAMKTMRDNTDIDSANNIIALWHDESHWNKHLLDKLNIKKLSPAYLYPEGWSIPFDPKILVRDKTKYGGHDKLRNTQDFLALINKTTKMKPPTIDVIIPLFNGAPFIAQALDSVISQTLTPTRIIVVNDGSSDKGPEIVLSFQKKSLIPIEIITQENKGLSAARNTGIAHATSEYIAFLDADDMWLPEKLEDQIRVFKHSDLPNIGLVYCGYTIITPIGTIDPSGFVVPIDTTMRGMVFKKLINGNKIISSGSGVLIKRSVFDTVGLFNEKLRFGEDWDMWLRVAQIYNIDYTPKVLVYIRRHANNMTSSKQKVFKGEILFYITWLPYLTKNKISIPLKWRLKILYKIITLFPPISLIKKALPVFFIPRNTFYE